MLRIPLLILTLLIAGCAPADTSSAPATDSLPNDYTADALLAADLPQIARQLAAGDITSEALVQAYLDRIAAIDRAGPTLQSVLSINPNALEDARARDRQRAAGEPVGTLHGVPILLKDNIESRDELATTAGALALAANLTGRDSPLVQGLREAGAIILGKTNLSQWANFRSNQSVSGWTALGGQVRNPHMLDRSPCGSSSGSGAAIAASLAAGAVGTETNGSIICPAQVNGIVGFKPTVGLVSQKYIVPISSSQDTAGPMTKTVTGAAMMLQAMATGAGQTDYVAALDAQSLSGARVGVLRFADGSNDDIISHFDAALLALRDAGATLIEITESRDRDGTYWDASRDVLYYEFKATINAYLADAAPAVQTRSLAQLIEFNEAHAERELALFGQDIFVAANKLGGLDDPVYLAALDYARTFAGKDGIDALLREHDVDVLVSPSGPVASRIDPVNGDVWPNWAGAGWMAAVAGYPHATVPMGTVHGVPIGLSFLAARDQDAAVLSFAYAYEQRTRLRQAPQYHDSALGRPEISKAMRRP